eukprot:TRINITY_DN9745_c0_g2_i1.p1 TRINITY_DN9745_c0_g2~~TRINITY_DN9745_c0_g2_i1.p1  ORF type:complete len:535 (+),score=86.32 TRINITY_DN9745_c0_g2_i1:82-1605(+)
MSSSTSCVSRLREIFPSKSIDALTAISISHGNSLEKCVIFLMNQDSTNSEDFTKFQRNLIEEGKVLQTYAEFLSDSNSQAPLPPHTAPKKPQTKTNKKAPQNQKKRTVKKNNQKRSISVLDKNFQKNLRKMKEMFPDVVEDVLIKHLKTSNNDVLVASEKMIEEPHDGNVDTNMTEENKMEKPSISSEEARNQAEYKKELKPSQNIQKVSSGLTLDGVSLLSIDTDNLAWFKKAFMNGLLAIQYKKEAMDKEALKNVINPQTSLDSDFAMALKLQDEETNKVSVPKAVSLPGYRTEKEVLYSNGKPGVLILEKARGTNNVVVSVTAVGNNNSSYRPSSSAISTQPKAPTKLRFVDEFAWMYRFNITWDLPNAERTIYEDFKNSPYLVRGLYSVLQSIPGLISEFNEYWKDASEIDHKMVPVLTYYGCSSLEVSSIVNCGFTHDVCNIDEPLLLGLTPNSLSKPGSGRMLVCAALVGKRVLMKGEQEIAVTIPKSILPCFVVEYVKSA